MTEHYVTIFDSGFLPQALALHRSMERHAGAYQLWVLCMDQGAHDVLTALALPHVALLRAADRESPALKEIRARRSSAELCWTMKPIAMDMVFEAAQDARRVTYLDADLWFRGRPDGIFEEFDESGRAALITEHAFAPEDDESVTSGRFCAGFLSLLRERGEPVRAWWEQRCLEWCHARVEPGRYGDQKYLESWPLLFPSQVHILRRAEAMLGPWNARRFPIGTCLIYHFHGLRLLPHRRVSLASGKRLPRVVRQQIYRPYLDDLGAAVSLLGQIGHHPPAQMSWSLHASLWMRFLALEAWCGLSRVFGPGLGRIR